MLDEKDDIRSALEQWAARGDCGASAKAIAAHLAAFGECDGSYPGDVGDFGRCEALLDAVPRLREYLPLMAEVNAYWAALASRWEEIRAAKDRQALIEEIVKPIQQADPGHMPLGKGASLRVGANTFQGTTAKGTRDMMKPDPEFDQARDNAYRVTADELRQFIERFERLDAEKKDIAEQQKEVMAEAKGRGYDTKVMRKVIALRKRDRDDIAEEEAVLEMYREALGI